MGTETMLKNLEVKITALIEKAYLRGRRDGTRAVIDARREAFCEAVNQARELLPNEEGTHG